MGDLQDRIAIVTGGSSGIGRGIAVTMACHGADVVVTDLNADSAEAVAGEIRASGRRAQALRHDVTSWDSCRDVVREVLAALGRIDILVNNAGVTKDQLFMRMKRADWDTVLNTNLTSAFLLSQAVIGSMMKQRWGRIVNITSVVGQTGQAGQVNYAASKAGLIGLTMSVAREVASRNITCNAVAPGFIETAMTAVLADDLKAKLNEQIPLGRQGTDIDIAQAVKFLASEEAGYVTGHVLNVNGGMLMG
jgi:3-oxoacyl-[acyl-carrier protein] reductase